MSNNNGNHEISLQEAIAMTTLYRNNKPSNFPICETFDVDSITKLISTEGCKFLRIYYGMKEDMEADAILVAVNADEEDILPSSNDITSDTNNIILVEDGIRCPPDCPPSSPLNR